MGLGPVLAQTYTPKQVRLEGAGELDQAELLRTAALKPGAPVSKADIEAALQRLADTGSFSDISYTVGPAALVITVKPIPGSGALPVRYTNFVWWQPDELTKLIQARVPLYHGKLPLVGNLTDQVEAALKALLKDKGVDASITTVESRGKGGAVDGVALAISRPSVVLGQVTVQGSLPAVAGQLSKMQAGFDGQEFDLQVTSTAIPRNVMDVYQNAGFLDATADAPTFAPPRQDMERYAIDAATTVHPGEAYHIRQLRFAAPPPISAADAEKVSGLKAGDPAGAFTMQNAAGLVSHAYTKHGYLDASTRLNTLKDPATHTVDCLFTVNAGEVYHLASIDLSELPADVQTQFAAAWHTPAGAVVDDAFNASLLETLKAIHAPQMRGQTRRDRATHTVVVVLRPAGRSAMQP